MKSSWSGAPRVLFVDAWPQKWVCSPIRSFRESPVRDLQRLFIQSQKRYSENFTSKILHKGALPVLIAPSGRSRGVPGPSSGETGAQDPPQQGAQQADSVERRKERYDKSSENLESSGDPADPSERNRVGRHRMHGG